MVWGYLTEFWDSVVQVTVGGVDYTVAWFQSIGNAVAGAVGNLFEFVNHNLSDVFVFAGWFFEQSGTVLTLLFAPFQYVYTFLTTLFQSVFSDPIEPAFVTYIEEYVDNFPMLGVIGGGLALCLGLMIFFFILRKLSKI